MEIVGKPAMIKAFVNKSGGMAVWGRCTIVAESRDNIAVESTQRVYNSKKKQVESRSAIFDCYDQVVRTDIIPKKTIMEMVLYSN
jgi:hypothetical protein